MIKIIFCEEPIVKTTSGMVRGKTIEINNNCVEEYLNIPFAEPPLRELRFAKPMAITRPLNV